MSGILRREIAPISTEAWTAVEQHAKRVFKNHLSGRFLVDVHGPRGWKKSAVNLGRLEIHENQKVNNVAWAKRAVLPLIEVRVPFTLSQLELDNVTRGSEDPHFDALEQMAIELATFEDNAIYNGFGDGGICGLRECTPHKHFNLPQAIEECPQVISDALELLGLAGVGGPYALVLGADYYHRLVQSTETGYPLYKVIRALLDGPIARTHSMAGGVLLSTRGDDFEMSIGQDISIGYAYHDRESVELYFTESFTFRPLEPSAAVALDTPG